VRDSASENGRALARGELVRLAYRLGKQQATGVLAVSDGGRIDVFVLRRGGVVIGDGELARRAVINRLARLTAVSCAVRFDGGVAAAPPGTQPRVALASWAREHLESQLDGALAEALTRDLAGVRVTLRRELAPEPIDDVDRRLIAAMAQPRRLDQIWPLARTSRFRLLGFVHVARCVGALDIEGIVAERTGPLRAIDPRRRDAARVLGVAEGDDVEVVKRAYRKLARALHPDLQPAADAVRRRALERRFAEVTAAYDILA
jgi:DnaJ-domain-containing protein 1